MQHIDYRPARLILDNLDCAGGDLLSLPFRDGSIGSLSCMHVVEHVGLGRYGDPIDPLGDVRAARELTRVLAPQGHLYFVAPVGRARVCFNAHRIYEFESVLGLFPDLDLEQCALIPDDATSGMMQGPSPTIVNEQNYGCGCFVFRKSR